jgi:hypothetical protein
MVNQLDQQYSNRFLVAQKLTRPTLHVDVGTVARQEPAELIGGWPAQVGNAFE